MIFIIKGFQMIVFIFIVITTKKRAGGHIGRNVVEITIKMKTIVRKPLMITTLIGYLMPNTLYTYIVYI